MENYEFYIDSNGMNGEGISRLNGKVYFINGAIEADIPVFLHTVAALMPWVV